MIMTYLVILVFFVLSNYLFTKMRYILNFMSMILGVILFMNDLDNTIVADSIVKLSYMLAFVLYGLMVYVHIYSEE